MGEHLPVRPSWRCRSCDQPWPCRPARLALVGEFGARSTGLRIQLATYLEPVARDQPQITPADLYRRFIAWLPS